MDIPLKQKAKLQEIEEKCNAKVLYAIESGSRAWDFASKDSNYDVCFIYARKTEDYLKLEKTRDVIEYELNDIYDINGWDVKKFLPLLQDSNPVIFEWAQSPIVYKTSSSWEKISAIINDFAIYKKYLYVLRPILCCHWILEKKSWEILDKLFFEIILFEKLYDFTATKLPTAASHLYKFSEVAFIKRVFSVP